jgi:hypothetical protein
VGTNKVQIQAPVGAMCLAVAGVAAAFAALVATDSFVVYVAVGAAAWIPSMVWGIARIVNERRRVERERDPARPYPYVELVWPTWAGRAVHVYIAVLALSFVVLLVVGIAATVEQAR